MPGEPVPSEVAPENHKEAAAGNLKEQGHQLDPSLANLLEQFSQTAQPPTSRVNHTVPQIPLKPVGLLSSWRYVSFIASQGKHGRETRMRAPVIDAPGCQLQGSHQLLSLTLCMAQRNQVGVSK